MTKRETVAVNVAVAGPWHIQPQQYSPTGRALEGNIPTVQMPTCQALIVSLGVGAEYVAAFDNANHLRPTMIQWITLSLGV